MLGMAVPTAAVELHTLLYRILTQMRPPRKPAGGGHPRGAHHRSRSFSCFDGFSTLQVPYPPPWQIDEAAITVSKHGAPPLGPWHRHRMPLRPRPLAKREQPRTKRYSSHAAMQLAAVQQLQPAFAASKALHQLARHAAGDNCCGPPAADAHVRGVAQLSWAQLGSTPIPKRPGGCSLHREGLRGIYIYNNGKARYPPPPSSGPSHP